MSNFFDGFSDTPRKKMHFLKGTILGLLLGALIVTTAFFYFSGTINSQDKGNNHLASPNENNHADNDSENLDIAEEVKQYYMAVVNAAETVTPSVVGISNYGYAYDFWGRSSGLQEVGTGSGVIINEDGLIVTNYHVIERAEEIIVTLGSGEEVQADVVGADPPTDLAVLRVDKNGLPAVEFADTGNLRTGEPAIAIGNPLGLDFQQTVTLGVISAVERTITIQGQRFTFIQTDAAINDGNSGGALVNIYGKVIGINTAKIKIPGVEGMGFAIPSNTVNEIINALIEEGRVIRPWLGVYISTLSPMDAHRFELPVDYGVVVNDVVSRGPAEKAGIQQGDIIIDIDGRKISNTAVLQDVLYQMNVGDEARVTVIRDYEEAVLEVILEKMPEE